MLIISFQAVGSNCMSSRQNDRFINSLGKRSILQTNERSDIFDFNQPAGGGAIDNQPDSGSITTTPFPRITIFDDHRDETLKAYIGLGLQFLDRVMELYVSIEVLFIFYQ